jgi:hypothetical protein
MFNETRATIQIPVHNLLFHTVIFMQFLILLDNKCTKVVQFRASVSVTICQREYVIGTTEYEDKQG